MRVLISGGGTGGHVYPALAVVEQLRTDTQGGGFQPAEDALYLSGKGDVEGAILSRKELPVRTIEAGGLRGVGLWAKITGVRKLAVGISQAWTVLRAFQPDVIFATGGYVCVPPVLAAWVQRIPTLLYLPDIEPGLAVQFLTRFADRVAVSFGESERFLPRRKLVVTGYPVRAELFGSNKQEARRRLDLEPDETTLLVFGGSQGAHSINMAVGEALPELLGLCQIVHVSGARDEEWLKNKAEQVDTCQNTKYSVYSYLHHKMLDALTAADLVVARSGAAVLGEFPAVGLPSILVPYPYAGRHQRTNAEFLAWHGAAWIVEDDEVGGNALLKAVRELLLDEETRARMTANAKGLARPEAACRLAAELRRMAGERNGY